MIVIVESSIFGDLIHIRVILVAGCIVGLRGSTQIPDVTFNIVVIVLIQRDWRSL
jgi:hypothetical protein